MTNYLYPRVADENRPLIALYDSDNFPASVHEWTAADGATTSLNSRQFVLPAYSFRDGGYMDFTITGYYTQTASTSISCCVSIDGTAGAFAVMTTSAAATTGSGLFCINGRFSGVSDAESGTFAQFLSCDISLTNADGTILSPTTAKAPGCIGYVSLAFDPNVDHNIALRMKKSNTAGSVIDSIRSWTATIYPSSRVI